MFGFKRDGGTVVVTALTFSVVLMAPAYLLGPISGGHLNPVVHVL
jgi:glycerol uptake facilitator-like aquaporin